jgi:histidine triad (HIT) family protein
MHMAHTVFAKILAGELSCHRVHEDAHTLAFMDIEPLAHGHVLLIPKEPAETLDALSDASAAAIGRVLPRLCRAVMAATGTTAYNVIQNNRPAAGQAVPHVHFHIVPKGSAEHGLRLQWLPVHGDDAVLARLAGEIASAYSKDGPA